MNQSVYAPSLMRLLFILLMTFSVSLVAADRAKVDVVEKDILYQPGDIHIAVGHTLHIVNNDPFFHKSRISRLNSDGTEGDVVMPAHIEQPKTTTDFEFDKPGHYKLRCMVHDGMTANINVAP